MICLKDYLKFVGPVSPVFSTERSPVSPVFSTERSPVISSGRSPEDPPLLIRVILSACFYQILTVFFSKNEMGLTRKEEINKF